MQAQQTLATLNPVTINCYCKTTTLSESLTEAYHSENCSL